MRFTARGAAAVTLACAIAALSGCAATSKPPAESVIMAAPYATPPGAPASEPFTDARVRALLPTLVNGASPEPGLVTGGQVDSAGLLVLAREGVRTVLDLRGPSEDRGFDEAGVAHQLGLDYVSLPVTPETLGDADFSRFRAVLSDEARAPFLVHCASGNRVGALMIPRLVLDLGLPADSAVAVAKRVGLKSDALREKALDYLTRHPASKAGAAPGK